MLLASQTRLPLFIVLNGQRVRSTLHAVPEHMLLSEALLLVAVGEHANTIMVVVMIFHHHHRHLVSGVKVLGKSLQHFW
jgi:hypothetical protein